MMKRILFGFLCILGLTHPMMALNPSPRSSMKELVLGIRAASPKGFQIVVNNGRQLLTKNGQPDGLLDTAYLNAIDAFLIESVFYTYRTALLNEKVDIAQDPQVTQDMLAYLDRLTTARKPVWVVDFAKNPVNVTKSQEQNKQRGYLSYQTPMSDYKDFPANASGPFAYFINPDWKDITRQSFLEKVTKSNFSTVIIPPDFQGKLLTSAELASLKTKPDGSKRIILGYLSIGQAETWRSYWKKEWPLKSRPDWLGSRNATWGSYEVMYWKPSWHELIYKGPDSQLKQFIQQGFDGVMLDCVDAYQYWEELK